MAQEGIVLTETQRQALEKQRQVQEAQGQLDTAHPGYLGCQDTYYVGNFKAIGKVYGQVFIDSYTRVADTKLYEEKRAITSADLLNDRVLPWYQEQGVPLLRILTDRGSEYKGKVAHHAYELFLSVEGIAHSTTKAYSPQSHGICERFNKTMQEEFFETAMRKQLYESLAALQTDLARWLVYYNRERPHSGQYCYGQAPLEPFLASQELALEKTKELAYLEGVSGSHPITDRKNAQLHCM